MSLLFNKLSGLAIAFFPRGKGLLISWLQSPSTVILEPKKVKSVSVSTFFPSICNETVMSDRKCYRKYWSEKGKYSRFLSTRKGKVVGPLNYQLSAAE